MIKLIVGSLWDNIISFALGALLTNRSTVKLWFQSLIRWNRRIRFSISYLYKIRIDNRYLLIRGKNIEQYQPIGGVYKYNDTFQEKTRNWNVTFEDQKGFYEDGDLRFFTDGRYVKQVLDWFNTRKNREVTIYREFHEELIEPKILSLDSLPRTKFEYLRNVKTKIKFSTHFETDEILVYDIFRVYLSKEDERIIKEELSKSHSELILVDAKNIEKGHYQIDKIDRSIGAHAKHIL